MSNAHERSSPVGEYVDRSAEEVNILQIHWRLAVSPFGHEISPPSSPEKYTVSIAHMMPNCRVLTRPANTGR